MGISAKEAATLTGLSKQAIIKSINLGKISAVKDVDGSWQIEPVELFRHYPPLSTSNGNGHQPVDGPSVDAYQVEVKLLRELLSAKDDQLADLRQRLDQETGERRRLTLLLEDKQRRPVGSRWWARLLGG